jgi:hypothetical protein
MLCLHNVALTCCVCYRLCVLLQRARMKCDKWRASILTRTDLWVNQPHAECSAGTNSETWLNRNRHSICDSRRGPMFNPGMRGQRIVARDLDLRSANSVLPSTRISKRGYPKNWVTTRGSEGKWKCCGSASPVRFICKYHSNPTWRHPSGRQTLRGITTSERTLGVSSQVSVARLCARRQNAFFTVQAASSRPQCVCSTSTPDIRTQLGHFVRFACAGICVAATKLRGHNNALVWRSSAGTKL